MAQSYEGELIYSIYRFTSVVIFFREDNKDPSVLIENEDREIDEDLETEEESSIMTIDQCVTGKYV